MLQIIYSIIIWEPEDKTATQRTEVASGKPEEWSEQYTITIIAWWRIDIKDQ